jgi:hypothetical protein
MQPLTGLFSVAALFTVGSHVIPFGLIFIIAYSQRRESGGLSQWRRPPLGAGCILRRMYKKKLRPAEFAIRQS